MSTDGSPGPLFPTSYSRAALGVAPTADLALRLAPLFLAAARSPVTDPVGLDSTLDGRLVIEDFAGSRLLVGGVLVLVGLTVLLGAIRGRQVKYVDRIVDFLADLAG